MWNFRWEMITKNNISYKEKIKKVITYVIYKELINTEKTWLGRWLIGQSASCHASVNDVGSEPQNPSKFCCVACIYYSNTLSMRLEAETGEY